MTATVVEDDADVSPGDAFDEEHSTFTPVRRELVISRLDFRNRFSMNEKLAIYTIGETNVAAKVWLDDLAAAGYVSLEDERTIAGVNWLVSAGILTQQRADEILW
jgi:hypothetical protein